MIKQYLGEIKKKMENRKIETKTLTQQINSRLGINELKS